MSMIFRNTRFTVEAAPLLIQGQIATPADFNGIAWETWRHVATGSDVQTGGGSVQPSDVVIDPPEADGTNFRLQVPAVDISAEGDYEVRVIFTDSNNEISSDIWLVTAIHAPP